jgi:hypothetical protein
MDKNIINSEFTLEEQLIIIIDNISQNDTSQEIKVSHTSFT